MGSNHADRQEIADMSDREVLNEILVLLRAGQDAIESAMQNPMLAAMLPR